MSLLNQIPGYGEAIDEEQRRRSLAWLDLTEELCGVEVVPLTLRRQRVLIVSGNPLMCGGRIGEGDVAAFLWAMQENYSGDKDARAAFIAKLAATGSLTDLEKCYAEICEWLEWQFNDAPVRACGSVSEGAVLACEASIVDTFASAYGWDPESILDKPLTRLFQLLFLIAKRHNPDVPFIPRHSMRIRGEWLKQLIAQQAEPPNA